MKRIYAVISAIIVSIGMMAQHQSVGLVLSGGGAKGIAHIGVIAALEENDIPIDYVAGTSMGAIVGGLYACGYTPDEMLELIMSRGFSYWSTGQIDPDLLFEFNRPAASPAMFSTVLSRSEGPDSVAQSLISGLPMSFAFMELFSGYTAVCGGDFNRLFVPFRCVASNVTRRCKQVMSSGSLGDAIRASMSFPIVFQPIEVDGELLYDGGIYDNFPVDVMRSDFSPSIMIGVDVSATPSVTKTSLMDQIDNLVIQNNDYDLPSEQGIKLRIVLDEFSLLDFARAREIYKIGYDYAMAHMDSIRGRIHSRTPEAARTLQRRVFRAKVPELRFEQVNVSGGNAHQNEYLQYMFNHYAVNDTLGIEGARNVFYAAISSGKLRDLAPRAEYNDSTGLFSLNLRAAVKGSLKGSLGTYISSSTSSFLFASVGYSSLGIGSFDTRLDGWVGQSTMAADFNARLMLHTSFASALGVEALISRDRFFESDHIFFDESLPSFVINRQLFGRLYWICAPARHATIEVGSGVARMWDTYYDTSAIGGDSPQRRQSTNVLGQVYGRYIYNTLDNPTYPTAGHNVTVTAMGVLGRNTLESAHQKSDLQWAQIELRGLHFPSLSDHFTLGFATDILLSTRKLLADYGATIASAPIFAPTPAARNGFRADFRANSFAAIGVVPVYRPSSSISTRLSGHVFMPLRSICMDPSDGSAVYGRWLHDPEFFTELDVCYHFPFGTLAAYTNYSTDAANHWSVGISFGIHILPQNFLR